VVVPSPTGTTAAVNKYPTVNIGTTEVFRVDGPGTMAVQPGHFDDLVFLGALNGDVQAISVSRDGETRWRFTGGSAVTRSPVAVDVPVSKDQVDPDVYITTERQGLARLNRETGEPVWRVPRGRRTLESIPEADRFLAANRKFVYATDRSGRLLVIDRTRGGTLSSYDFHDFVFPVVNEWTDRLFLAANNGLIVCLHDKEFLAPVALRQSEEKPFDVARLPKVDFEVKEELTRKLGAKYNDADAEPAPLRRVLNDFERRYNLRIDIVSDRNWQLAKMTPPVDKVVAYPKAEQLTTVAEALQKILDQANAHFVVHDRIYVVPGKLGGMDMGPDKPPDKPPEKPPEKDKPPDKDK
jgi:hypothetical protein